MKNSVAFVFTKAPYGSINAREGLDVLLSMSLLCEDIGVFFISDGVFLLLSNQEPEEILAKNFIMTFGLLSIYNVDDLYVCYDSVVDRGLGKFSGCSLRVKYLKYVEWRKKLQDYDVALTF